MVTASRRRRVPRLLWLPPSILPDPPMGSGPGPDEGSTPRAPPSRHRTPLTRTNPLVTNKCLGTFRRKEEHHGNSTHDLARPR